MHRVDLRIKELKISLPTVRTEMSLPWSSLSVARQSELSVISPSSELEDEPKKRKKESKMRRLIFLHVVDKLNLK